MVLSIHGRLMTGQANDRPACAAWVGLAGWLRILAFAHALSRRLLERLQARARIPAPADWMVRENKWRASRWGLAARLIRSERGETERIDSELLRLAEELRPEAAALGCAAELAEISRHIASGGSYTRQRRWFQQTGRSMDVVQGLLKEFATDQLFD